MYRINYSNCLFNGTPLFDAFWFGLIIINNLVFTEIKKNNSNCSTIISLFGTDYADAVCCWSLLFSFHLIFLVCWLFKLYFNTRAFVVAFMLNFKFVWLIFFMLVFHVCCTIYLRLPIHCLCKHVSLLAIKVTTLLYAN